MNKWLLVLGLIWLLGSVTGTAGADEPLTADDPPPSYRVEVIVFTQPPIQGEYREAPRVDPVDRLARFAWTLRDPGDEGLGYQRLPGSEMQLASAAQRLERREGFKVHWHAAWEQPGRERELTQAVAMPANPDEVSPRGMIRVYLGRFLHAEIDLQMAPDDDTLARFDLADDDQDPARWILRESRRMRSAETHYIDHPAMGVIIRVEPVTPAP